jgi:phytoene dehydrogenase-like protein
MSERTRRYPAQSDVVVVGGGLSGLIAARQLQRANRNVILLESSDRIGGRIKTDWVRGFRLDHGFQVFLDAYPVASEQLDVPRLRLRKFAAGALIRAGGHFVPYCDPLRQPAYAIQTALAPIGEFLDKLRVAKFKREISRKTVAEIMESAETSSVKRLRQFGFSKSMIDQFFRPFFGGVFFDADLETSSRMLEFTFKMFSAGNACLPADGMEAIPRQLAAGLKRHSLFCDSTVDELSPGEVVVEGEKIACNTILVATESPTADRLLRVVSGESTLAGGAGQQTTCYYFATPHAPQSQPILMLRSVDEGPTNHVAIPSLVQSSYAPPGQHLVSVNTLGIAQEPAEEKAAVLAQMRDWFGGAVDDWEHLRTYRIRHALPNQRHSGLHLSERAVADGIYRCGDYCHTASIEGAITSGLAAAKEILNRTA